MCEVRRRVFVDGWWLVACGLWIVGGELLEVVCRVWVGVLVVGFWYHRFLLEAMAVAAKVWRAASANPSSGPISSMASQLLFRESTLGARPGGAAGNAKALAVTGVGTDMKYSSAQREGTVAACKEVLGGAAGIIALGGAAGIILGGFKRELGLAGGAGMTLGTGERKFCGKLSALMSIAGVGNEACKRVLRATASFASNSSIGSQDRETTTAAMLASICPNDRKVSALVS